MSPDQAVGTREPDSCSAPYRVRFDEAGPDGLLRTSVLLRYAQDLASYHSAERGFGRAWYAERGLTWLVRAAEVAVTAPVTVGSELVGTTRVVGWRRVWARRRTDFLDADGGRVAWVHIDWVLLDRRGSPTRIPAEFEPVFGAAPTRIELGRVDHEASPPDATRVSLTVRPHELDPMDHVNNAVYADWVEEAVITAGGRDDVRSIPRVARLDYARAAESGATVDVTAWAEPGGSWSCRIADAGGTDLLRARLEPRTGG